MIGIVIICELIVFVIDMVVAIGFRVIDLSEYKSCYFIVIDCLWIIVVFMVCSIEKIIECDWCFIEFLLLIVGKNVFVIGIMCYKE